MPRELFLKQLGRAVRSHHQLNGGNGSSTALRDRFASLSEDSHSNTLALDFDPADFSDWPPTTQSGLADAIREFRSTTVGSANRENVEAKLSGIVETVGPIVRSEWLAAVDSLVQQAEGWARSRDWAVRRYPKEIEDPVIQQYEVPQLLIHLREGRVMLDPVTRFVAGGTGLIELYAMPSLSGQSLVRRDGGWEFIPTRATGKPLAWSEQSFETAVRTLIRDSG